MADRVVLASMSSGPLSQRHSPLSAVLQPMTERHLNGLSFTFQP